MAVLEEASHLQLVHAFLSTLPPGSVKNHLVESIAAFVDPICRLLNRHPPVLVHATDILVLAIYHILRQASFRCIGAWTRSTETLTHENLPSDWSSQSSPGRVFQFQFQDAVSDVDNNLSENNTIVIKMMFVQNDSKLHIHACHDQTMASLELNVADYLDDDNRLKVLTALRILLFSKILHKFKLVGNVVGSSTTTTTSSLSHAVVVQDPPVVVPTEVGQSDVLPECIIGGGHYPGSEVGPDHPIFDGRQPHPTLPQGPVPGARFDPLGPVTGPSMPSFPFPGRHARPGFIDGEPNPDHLRMPDPYGIDELTRNMRGGLGSGPRRPGAEGAPFGSDDNMF